MSSIELASGINAVPAGRLIGNLDASSFATLTLDFRPDPKQIALLDAPSHRVILNCSRQWGKSTITAIKALHQAWCFPKSEILVASPSERQSAEFLRKTERFIHRLDLPVRRDGANRRSLAFPNGSRIVGLPCAEATTRGFSGVNLLIVDEAAQIPDAYYHALRPTTSTTSGDIWLISTPYGQRGFFWDTWTHGPSQWFRLSVPAPECPRIPAAFLEEERQTLPERMFRQEYLCAFTATGDAVFSEDLLEAALCDDINPLFAPGKEPR